MIKRNELPLHDPRNDPHFLKAVRALDEAVQCQRLGRNEEADRLYAKVLKKNPDYFDALNQYGLFKYQHGNLNKALELLKKATRINPRSVNALNNLGAILCSLRQTQEALETFERALVIDPTNAQTLNNRGNAFADFNRLDDALTSFERALKMQPNYCEAHINRGRVLLKFGRIEEALAAYNQAVIFAPFNASVHNNRGGVLQNLCRIEEALASYDKAIALKPDYVEAYNNRGVALQDLNRPVEALASYDKAIALKPEYAEAYWNQSLCLLLMGRFERGWRQHEWRKKRDKPVAARSYPQPLWLGDEDITGKTLFIWWEQGLGDTIQFCRYAKLAEVRGAKVIMSVQKTLRGLLNQISPTIQIIDQDEVPTNFDYHCPLLSLPLAFKTTLSNIPANTSYLKSRAEKSLFWKDKLGGKDKLRVGLVWSGGFRPNQPELWSVNKRRNIPLGKFAVLKNPDIDFYSLQKGQPAESELAELIRDNWGGPHIFDFTSLLNDFSDTAALVENLDLVISVDTSTAHLAGALGKPVWILNRFDTDWRWLLDRTDSPWYITAKLYRQEKAGDWDDVVRRVKTDLISFQASSGL